MTTSKRPDTITVYRDGAGDFRWRRTAPNGEIVGASHEGFTRESAALENVLRCNADPELCISLNAEASVHSPTDVIRAADTADKVDVQRVIDALDALPRDSVIACTVPGSDAHADDFVYQNWRQSGRWSGTDEYRAVDPENIARHGIDITILRRGRNGVNA